MPPDRKNGLRRWKSVLGEDAARRRLRRMEYGDHWLRRRNWKRTSELLLEEYKSLRAEVAASLSAQYTVLGFGAATLGFVLAAATQITDEHDQGMLLLVLFPLLSYLVLTIWVTEVLRMMRAGAFVMRLEKRADEQFGAGALTWESSLFHSRCRGGFRDAMQDPDLLRTVAIALLFGVLSAVAITMGWGSVHGYAWQRILPLVAGGSCAVALGAMWVIRSQELDRLLSPLLRKGDMGYGVAELQSKLVAEGFFDPDRVDGIFGDETKAAVKAFQESADIEVDGIAGLMTWTRLDEATRFRLACGFDEIVERCKREGYNPRCECMLVDVPAARHCDLASPTEPGVLELTELDDGVVIKIWRRRSGRDAWKLVMDLAEEFGDRRPLLSPKRLRGAMSASRARTHA